MRKLLNQIAEEQAKLRLERKINQRERLYLNRTANELVFRNKLISAVDKYKGVRPNEIEYKQSKNKENIVYIIADEHFRGKEDKNAIKQLYTSIKQDIAINKYTNVEIGYLGDAVDGLIHIGSLTQSEGAIEPTVLYANLTIEYLNQIKEVKKVCYISKSNHTQFRPFGTKRSELPKEDLGTVIVSMMKTCLRKDIKFESNDIISTLVGNKNVVMLHGHQSFAKSKDKMLEYFQQLGVVPDMIGIGHYHSFKVTEYAQDRYLCVAPAAKKGNSEYDKDHGFISYGQIVKMSIYKNNVNGKVIKV